ncbi:MAG: hypothetical protein V2A74_01925, partial [bacterium]
VADQMFSVANQGNDQVVCVWTHENEDTFISQLAGVDQRLHTAAAAYPDVEFLYCNAKEAMQTWLATTDTSPPPLDLSVNKAGNTITVTVASDSDIYSAQPWIAARRYDGTYLRMDTEQLDDGLWRFAYDTNVIDRVVVAATDLYGNVRLAEVIDGSHSWSTQSEFYRGILHNVDVETSATALFLERGSGNEPVISQPNADGQTEPLRRSYWIAQTFMPQSSGISRVVFGATVTQPSAFRVELRSMLPSGFPDDNPSALLAAATTSLDQTGTASVSLNYNGLALDGRSYVLVFKAVSGSARLRITTANPYPNGQLLRAFSLDWLKDVFTSFDCQFQIYDLSGQLSISQMATNSSAYISERGYLVAQTFRPVHSRLDALELNVTEAQAGAYLDVQLRPTLTDSSPDFAFDSLVVDKSFSIPAAGIQRLALDWALPGDPTSQTWALTFTIPENNASTVRLASASSNPYSDGEVFTSDDLVSVQRESAQDLWFKIYATSYVSSGTLTLRHDAQSPVYWTRAKVDSHVLDSEAAETVVSARFRFADTADDLESALWSEFDSSPRIEFSPAVRSRYVESEIFLGSSSTSAPVLDSLELFYAEQPSAASPMWGFYLY